jgi:hypothetical protein
LGQRWENDNDQDKDWDNDGRTTTIGTRITTTMGTDKDHDNDRDNDYAAGRFSLSPPEFRPKAGHKNPSKKSLLSMAGNERMRYSNGS